MNSEVYRTSYFAWRKYARLVEAGVKGVRYIDHETGDKYEIRWPK